MRISRFTAIAVVGAVGAVPLDSRAALKSDDLTAQGVLKLGLYLQDNGYPNEDCTLQDVAVRREWCVPTTFRLDSMRASNIARSTLSATEKKEYISAVQCLSKLPAKTPAALAAGAKNRYDDFVATHVNQTLSIHGTVRFLN